MKVTIRPMGGRAKSVEVAKNAKVKTILKEAGIEVSKSTTMIANGTFLKVGSTMGKHREILLIPKVEGGQ